MPPLTIRETLWFIRGLLWLRLKRKLRLVTDADIQAENERLRAEIAQLDAEVERHGRPAVRTDE